MHLANLDHHLFWQFYTKMELGTCMIHSSDRGGGWGGKLAPKPTKKQGKIRQIS